MGIDLDFTKLEGLFTERLSTPQIDQIQPQEDFIKKEPYDFFIDRLAQMKASAEEIQARHQTARKDSGQVKAEILKGIKSGQDIHLLFLKACEAISIATQDESFYKQADSDITAVYGHGFKNPATIEKEIQETENRLNRLRDAEISESDDNAHKRISNAIKAHEERLTDLRKMLGNV
jgi:hypothetical protein